MVKSNSTEQTSSRDYKGQDIYYVYWDKIYSVWYTKPYARIDSFGRKFWKAYKYSAYTNTLCTDLVKLQSTGDGVFVEQYGSPYGSVHYYTYDKALERIADSIIERETRHILRPGYTLNDVTEKASLALDICALVKFGLERDIERWQTKEKLK